MAFDRKFDPITQDFVRDGKGGFVRTETAETSMFNMMVAKRGKWWGDPELGTLEDGLRELQGNPVPDSEQAFKRGLGRLEQMGRITDITVKATEDAPGRIFVQTDCRDTSTGLPVTARVKSGG